MKTNKGFTLIELMIVIVIAAIMVTIAVPSMRTMIQNNRITTQANLFLGALNVARSEAVKRGKTVSICSSANQTSCAGNNAWEAGWIVFVDDSGTAGTRDGTDAIIRVWSALAGGSTLAEGGTASYVQYQTTGTANAAASFSLTIPDCIGDQVRTIAISATGRANVTKSTCP